MNFLNLGQGHILNLASVASFHFYVASKGSSIPEEPIELPLVEGIQYELQVVKMDGSIYYIVDQEKIKKLAKYFS